MKKKITFGLLSMVVALGMIMVVGCSTGNDEEGGTPATEEKLYVFDGGRTGDDVIDCGTDQWGTGAIQNFAYALDATYNPCIEVESAGGQWGNTVAFGPLTAGTLAGVKKLYFKVKSEDYDYIVVQLPKSTIAGATDQQYFFADGTDLENGWVQIVVDITADIGDCTDTDWLGIYYKSSPLTENGTTVPAETKFYLADVYFTK